MKKNKKGFSLMEVLVFISILSIFFVAAMTVTTYSLKSMKTQEYKILATHLAEETVEWVKSEKESNWTQFTTHDTSTGIGTTYCLENFNWSFNNACSNYSLGSPAIFKREILIKNLGSPTSQVNTTISVKWLETNGEMEVSIDTIHSIIE